MSQTKILTSDVICDAQLARRIRNKLASILKRSGEHSDLIDPLLLACTEHLANLYQHSSGAKCDVLWQERERVLEIFDDGPAIDALLNCAPKIDESEPPLIQESGMGLSLIASLFPRFEYLPSSHLIGKNCIRLPLPTPMYRVVVVDDDPVFLSLVSAYLAEEYLVDAYNTPQEALDSEALSSASMVICDVHMPGTSGYQFREHLLSKREVALIPFLFMTGDDTEQQRTKASQWQIDDFLVKPLKKSSFLATVQRILLRSRRLKMQLNHQIDESVNRSLWPKGPWCISQLEISFDYVVAERGGGDFLCQLKMPFGHRFILGDVMGHGEQAKFFAFALTGFITGLCETIESRTDPCEFMSALSRQMCCSTLIDETVATLLIVDTHENGQLEICSAGHPAPYILRCDDRIESIVVSGVLPGLDLNAKYYSKNVSLLPGDSVFCYTDGLVEALLYENDDVALDAELNLAVNSGLSIRQASHFAHYWSFPKRMLDDDVSVLVIHHTE